MKKNKTSIVGITIFFLLMTFLICFPINLYGQTDTTPPVLVDFNFDPKTIDVSGGSQVVYTHFEITDDLSGLASAYVSFCSPSGQICRGDATWNLVFGTPLNGVYEGQVHFPQFIEAGTYKINNITLNDQLSNTKKYYEADLIAMNFPTELEVVSEPTIESILIFFDEAFASGTLIGNGPGNSADGRLNALRNMLVEAGVLIDKGEIEEACGQLTATFNKCDGYHPPPDFVAGPAASDLSDMITGLMESLGCE